MEATALRYPDSEPEPLGTFELTTSLSTTLCKSQHTQQQQHVANSRGLIVLVLVLVWATDGDTKLFFEHGRMEADIEANPEWFRRGLNESYVCYGHV